MISSLSMWGILCAILPVFIAALGDKTCPVSLYVHNYYRANHSTPALTCNDQISQVAQNYADKLADTCTMLHSGNKAYGENLYMTGTTESYPAGDRASYQAAYDAVKAWYAEESCYDYSDPTFQSCRIACKTNDGCQTVVGHFTQLLWYSTTELGVGVSFCRKGGVNWTIVVANYYPKGNYRGQFAANVLNYV